MKVIQTFPKALQPWWCEGNALCIKEPTGEISRFALMQHPGIIQESFNSRIHTFMCQEGMVDVSKNMFLSQHNIPVTR